MQSPQTAPDGATVWDTGESQVSRERAGESA